MTTEIIVGDCREVLRGLPAASVHCVVTSPPYFGLRDYGVDGQIGLEETPSAYIAEMVEVFREVWRVLRDDGTLWLNMGDSYAGSWGAQGRRETESDNPSWHASSIKNRPKRASRTGSIRQEGLKAKDLMGIPWRLAFALQDAGWYLRRDIIWSKPNPMPESVTDRPSTAHEYVFLMTKRPDYFYDGEAIKEPDAGQDHRRGVVEAIDTSNGHLSSHKGIRTAEGRNGWGRNARSVWTIVTESFTGAHFATFPTKLAETCIKAGTSEWGCCPTCGAPWQRVVTKGEPNLAHRRASGADKSGGYNGQSTKDHDAAGVQNASDVKRRILDGMRHKTSTWTQGCTCAAAAPTPCMVLDPFAGACTTLMVADRLRRNSIGIELSPAYAKMGAKRLAKDAGMFAEVSGVDGDGPPALDRQAAFDLMGSLAASERIPAAE